LGFKNDHVLSFDIGKLPFHKEDLLDGRGDLMRSDLFVELFGEYIGYRTLSTAGVQHPAEGSCDSMLRRHSRRRDECTGIYETGR
jgi:hypothetical protein